MPFGHRHASAWPFDAIQDAVAEALIRTLDALDTHEQVQDLGATSARLEHPAV